MLPVSLALLFPVAVGGAPSCVCDGAYPFCRSSGSGHDKYCYQSSATDRRSQYVCPGSCTASFDPAVIRQVMTNSWWYPADQGPESAGVLSRGIIYVMAMMESGSADGKNDTRAAAVLQEMLDTRDVAAAGGATLLDLVDCVANVAKGQTAATRAALLAALPAGAPPPALTFVEQPGEFEWANKMGSVTCAVALPGEPKQEFRSGSARGVLRRGAGGGGLVFVAASGGGGAAGGARRQAAGAFADVGAVVSAAGGAGLRGVADCTVYVADITDAAAARAALSDALGGAPAPATTLVQAGLERGDVALRCVAAVGGDPPRRATHGGVVTVTAGGLVYTDAVLAKSNDTSDAMAALAGALKGAGTDMSNVLTCMYWMVDQDNFMGLNTVFTKVFKQYNRPSRAEFGAASECADCAHAVKCIATLPK